jgi:hypothetical protein
LDLATFKVHVPIAGSAALAAKAAALIPKARTAPTTSMLKNLFMEFPPTESLFETA